MTTECGVLTPGFLAQSTEFSVVEAAKARDLAGKLRAPVAQPTQVVEPTQAVEPSRLAALRLEEPSRPMKSVDPAQLALLLGEPVPKPTGPPSFTSLYGVTLGVTKLADLRAGPGTSCGNECWSRSGAEFNSSDGIVDAIYIRRSEDMPAAWKNAGLDFGMSYNAWMTALRKLGDAVEMPAPSWKTSFYADVWTTVTGPQTVRIITTFSAPVSSGLDSRDTLGYFAIRI